MSFNKKKASVSDTNVSGKLDRMCMSPPKYTASQTLKATMRKIIFYAEQAKKNEDIDEKDKLGRWWMFLFTLYTLTLPSFIGHEPMLLHGSMSLVWWAIVIKPMNVIDVIQLLSIIDPQDLDIYWLGPKNLWNSFKHSLTIYSGGRLSWMDKDSVATNHYGGIKLRTGLVLIKEELRACKSTVPLSILADNIMTIPKIFENTVISIDIIVAESSHTLTKWRSLTYEPITECGANTSTGLNRAVSARVPSMATQRRNSCSVMQCTTYVLLATSQPARHTVGDENMPEEVQGTLNVFTRRVKATDARHRRGLIQEEMNPRTQMTTPDYTDYVIHRMLDGKEPVFKEEEFFIPLWALSHEGTYRLFALMGLVYVKLLVRLENIKKQFGLTDTMPTRGNRRSVWRAIRDLGLEESPFVKCLNLRRYIKRDEFANYDPQMPPRDFDAFGKLCFEYWVEDSTSFNMSEDGTYSYFNVITRESENHRNFPIAFTNCTHAFTLNHLAKSLPTLLAGIAYGSENYSHRLYDPTFTNCAVCRHPASNLYCATKLYKTLEDISNQSDTNVFAKMKKNGDNSEMKMFSDGALADVPGLVSQNPMVVEHLGIMRENMSSTHLHEEKSQEKSQKKSHETLSYAKALISSMRTNGSEEECLHAYCCCDE